MNHTKPLKSKCGHRIYQLDCGEYDRLVDHAGNRCQICGTAPDQTKHGFLVVDHDANVGQWAVRGLLCSTCNTGLPAGSTPAWAADYLKLPWWRREADRLGLNAEQLPEPGIGSVVLTPNRDVWRRGPEGWQQTANWRHKPTLSWDRLNHRFGPHRIRVRSERPAASEEQTASGPLIRRRSLPDSLRYLAQKLDGPLSDAERAGVALTLNSLADEIDPPSAGSVRPDEEPTT